MNKQEELLTEIRDLLHKMEQSDYSKENLLDAQIKSANATILDYEVNIEVSWKVLNQIQDEKKKLIDEVEENLAKVKAIKDMTPLPQDWEEQIQKLFKRNLWLGKTNKTAKNGDVMWAGEILQKDIAIERYRNEITLTVGKREYAKIRLKTLLDLKEKGWAPDFDKFQNEIVENDPTLKPIE